MRAIAAECTRAGEAADDHAVRPDHRERVDDERRQRGAPAGWGARRSRGGPPTSSRSAMTSATWRPSCRPRPRRGIRPSRCRVLGPLEVRHPDVRERAARLVGAIGAARLDLVPQPLANRRDRRRRSRSGPGPSAWTQLGQEAHQARAAPLVGIRVEGDVEAVVAGALESSIIGRAPPVYGPRDERAKCVTWSAQPDGRQISMASRNGSR